MVYRCYKCCIYFTSSLVCWHVPLDMSFLVSYILQFLPNLYLVYVLCMIWEIECWRLLRLLGMKWYVVFVNSVCTSTLWLQMVYNHIYIGEYLCMYFQWLYISLIQELSYYIKFILRKKPLNPFEIVPFDKLWPLSLEFSLSQTALTLNLSCLVSYNY